MPRSNIAFAFRRTSRPDCIGITRTFTASAKRKCSAELPGALIIEGIERANREVAGLPERVLVIRDQDLLNPDAPPSKSEPVVPRTLIDRDGDAANNGTGFGKPAKDLSINFVPVPYPDYPPAVIKMKPEERQLWRVLNASAITYLNLAVLFKRAPQMLGIVAIDGVPINENGNAANAIEWHDHIGVPPGGARGIYRERSAAGGAGAARDAHGRHRAAAARTIRTARWPRSSLRPMRRSRARRWPPTPEPLPPPRTSVAREA